MEQRQHFAANLARYLTLKHDSQRLALPGGADPRNEPCSCNRFYSRNKPYSRNKACPQNLVTGFDFVKTGD